MRAGIIVGLLATVALAQEQYEKFVEQAEKAIRSGLIVGVPLDKAAPILAGNPEWARRICAAAAACDLRHGLRDTDRLKNAAERIEEIGAQVEARHAEDADAAEARAEGLYFRLRVDLATGMGTQTADWLALAAALERQHELKPGRGEALHRAVERLREGEKADGVDADALKTRADEIAARAAEYKPVETEADKLRDELDEIEILANNGDYKTAKPRLIAFMQKAREDTHYNDAVTIARSHKKFYLKLDYRVRLEKFRSLLSAEIPRGDRWKTKSRGAPRVFEIEQYDRKGKLKRTFEMRYYKRNTWYVLGSTKYDGHNERAQSTKVGRGNAWRP